MTPTSAKRLVNIISVATILILCFVWWINGAELEDAWLYIVGIAIVLIPAFENYFKKSDKN